MADFLTRLQRSERMSRIRSRGNKNTELALLKIFRTHRITGWRRISKWRQARFHFQEAAARNFCGRLFLARMSKTFPSRLKERRILAEKTRDESGPRPAGDSHLARKGWQVLRIWEHDLAHKNEARSLRILRKALV